MPAIEPIQSKSAKDNVDSAARDEHLPLDWWKGATIYQIYPRSFLDTTGDGVGDLSGIIKRLPYVASLGVDAVWLSPFFTSPMDDFGYDVADYCGVDPMFGTLADFDRLLKTAHRLGLKIIIDQVYSHTSDRHQWFIESRKDRTNSKADWYVWADPKPDGSPPNNWQSVFGGGSWKWDNARRQYYLHNFLTSQPDLNLFNDDVQKALLDVAKFWLDRGVDGFRLDAINFAMHDPELRDNPTAKHHHRPPTRPFDYQSHTRNMSHPDIPKFLTRVRNLLDMYKDRFAVAEVVGPLSLREMKAFTHGKNHLHSAYSFDYLYADDISPSLIIETASNWLGAPDEGWPSWAFSNHDAPRSISRWGHPEHSSAYAKMYGLLLLSLRGNAFIYQGEELGMVQGEIPFEALQDPEAIANWPETLGRDGARTPIPWQHDADNCGFSCGSPWLPVDRRHAAQAADLQETDPASILNFFRSAIALRRQEAVLRKGKIKFLVATDSVLAFERALNGKTILCVFNFATTPTEIPDLALPTGQVIFGTDTTIISKPCPATLPPASGFLVSA